jgi:hypothetical protein
MIVPDWDFIRCEARAALLSFYAPFVGLAAALGQFKKSTGEEVAVSRENTTAEIREASAAVAKIIEENVRLTESTMEKARNALFELHLTAIRLIEERSKELAAKRKDLGAVARFPRAFVRPESEEGGRPDFEGA